MIEKIPRKSKKQYFQKRAFIFVKFFNGTTISNKERRGTHSRGAPALFKGLLFP